MKKTNTMKKNKSAAPEKLTGTNRDDVKSQAQAILKIWKANREFRLRDTKFEDFEKVTAQYEQVLEKIETQTRELHELKVARNQLAPKVEKLSSRARSGMRGYFGPQSSEYQHVRRNQYQAPVAKTKKPAKAKSELPSTPPPPAAAPDSVARDTEAVN
jgi:hypothetical protein